MSRRGVLEVLIWATLVALGISILLIDTDTLSSEGTHLL